MSKSFFQTTMSELLSFFNPTFGLIIDLFSGGGGVSEGIRMVFGRDPDVAINHDPDAISMHQVNHRDTIHFTADVYEVDPLKVFPEYPVGALHLSPSCTHFSKALGGKPVSEQLRSLAWIGVKWAKLRRPRMIFLENVEEFADWCPLDDQNKPIESKKGETFNEFVAAFKSLGYEVEWKILQACDFGAPTSRKRLFMVARCDGLPIVWPQATHGDPQSQEVLSGQLKPWHTANEVVDFSISAHSIFMTKEEAKGQAINIRRPLKESTLRRIGKGLDKYVIKDQNPFILPSSTKGTIQSPWIIKNYGGKKGGFASSSKRPIGAITTVDHNALGTVVLTPFVMNYFGERTDKHGGKIADGRGCKLDSCLSTITAGGLRHAIVEPELVAISSGDTINTVETPRGNLCISHAVKFKGENYGFGMNECVQTITAGGNHFGIVETHCDPVTNIVYDHTIMSRINLVRLFIKTYCNNINDYEQSMGILTINGQKYQIIDIRFRMLTPRELYRAQGFREDYIIDRTLDGKPLNKKQQVKMCGNSVPPLMAKAVIGANYDVILKFKEAA